MKSVPYPPIICSLIYAMVATYSDIAHAIGVVRKFMHSPDQSHWNAIKDVLRYMVGTKDYNILFVLNKTVGIVGYTDSYFVGCLEN